MFLSQPTTSIFQVPQPPADTVSSIAWFPTPQNNQTFMAAGSWDKTLRLWEVRKNSNFDVKIDARVMFTHDAPILACCFSRQNVVFSAGCDHVVKVHNLTTSQSQVVGKHDAPICSVAFDDERNICVTGGWDSTVRYWDCRQPNAVHKTILSSNAKESDFSVYCMDVKPPTIIIGGSDKRIHLLNMQNYTAPPTVTETLLKLQLRSICLQPSRLGYAVTSIEGRCCMVYFDDSNSKSKRFTFKCHRVDDHGTIKVYPVNCTDFAPTQSTCLATGGSDGIISLWEVEKRLKLRDFDSLNAPVTQLAFDPSGQMLAFAASYDWHKGYNGCDHTKIPKTLAIHTLTPATLGKS